MISVMILALQKMYNVMTWEGRTAFLGGEASRAGLSEMETVKAKDLTAKKETDHGETEEELHRQA